MKIINETKDYYNNTIKVNDSVVIYEENKTGIIKQIYDNDDIDIYYNNTHQLPIIDTFNIKHHKIFKQNKIRCVRCHKQYKPNMYYYCNECINNMQAEFYNQ